MSDTAMKTKDLASLIVLGAIWGASFLFMRIAAPEFGPIALIEMRVLIGAVLLVAWMYWRGEASALLKDKLPLFVVGVSNSAIPFTLFAYASLTLPAGYASVLNATAPLFGALVAAVWLRELLPIWKIFGLVVGFTGVVVLVSGKLTTTDDRLAIGAGLAAALLYGFSAHYTKRKLSHVKPMVVATGSLIWASVVLMPLAIVFWPTGNVSYQSWLSALALGIVCTACAYVLYFRSIANIGPVKAVIVAYLIPVFGMLWGYSVLGEPITLVMLAGCAIVLLGLAMMFRTAKVKV
jgi:drug/metabolite transporter (DMT)-like permease